MRRAAGRSRRYRFITFLWVRFGLFRHAAERAAEVEVRRRSSWAESFDHVPRHFHIEEGQ